MRRRSPSYSPPRRGYRTPPRGRFGRHRDPPCGLLVRNIPKDSRPEEVRSVFDRYGRIRDVYLPKDFHTGEPRGFGFVQFLDPYDAAEARRQMDRQIFKGREISVVFAEENRKRPEEMRLKERARGRMSYGSYKRSPYRGRSRSWSPRSCSRSPRSGHYSRYHHTSSRRYKHESSSSSPYRSSRSRSFSPHAHRKHRGSLSHDRSRSRSPRSSDVDPDKRQQRSASNARSRSHSNDSQRRAKSSRSRSKSLRESRSPPVSGPSPSHSDLQDPPVLVENLSNLGPESSSLDSGNSL
ncbi:hypothetical protein KP509_04G106400 [Ceratopteris richardii]|uniref:RRM domain-containing protein n=1 Tax=Ceratopteris richardii TaxID=49495 RepID=A0A8T2UYX4_CERRI|nr:hypothetical protein KP509_04G106400 [Ceratopteris richardii]